MSAVSGLNAYDVARLLPSLSLNPRFVVGFTGGIS